MGRGRGRREGVMAHDLRVCSPGKYGSLSVKQLVTLHPFPSESRER